VDCTVLSSAQECNQRSSWDALGGFDSSVGRGVADPESGGAVGSAFAFAAGVVRVM